MKMSKMYMPTLKEVPAEAEIPSHQLLLRSGMTRRLVSGVYSYLPLGYRVIRKVEQVTREEMDKFGSQEVLMSAIQPRELWEATGRWEDFGPEMFKLKDRNNREFCLGPTHEEYFTNLVKNELKSYKQLPMNLYQIQTKYRDEKRPRFGFMRSREFIMKDAYTFDIDQDAMGVSYQNMWDAYDSVFTRLRMNYRVVQGDSGAMGGNMSHEFMAMSDYGESLVAYCNKCDYAATDEKAEVVYDIIENNEELLEMEKVHTPGVSTIDELSEFLDMPKNKLAKALMYVVKDQPVLCFVPGDREVNETKLQNYFKVGEHEMEMASDEVIRDVMGAEPGFAGPIGIKEDVRVLVDSRIAEIKNLVVGANEKDYHIKNVNFERDFNAEIVEDLLDIKLGDKCPKCGEVLEMARGIEVGNIFQLGTKYSEGIDATFLDENGKSRHFYMGSYGIGVSRTVAAIIEQNHDEDGIIWPIVLAPYQIIITIINMKSDEQKDLAFKIYDELTKKGLEVLIDDRDERAGVKFNDRDLIGIPVRITVGRDAKDEIVEYSLRRTRENQNIKVDEIEGKIREAFAEEEFNKIF